MNLYCDFECLTQAPTRVWLAGCLYDDYAGNEKFYTANNIDDFLKYILTIDVHTSTRAYFHNLKYDGSFIINRLLKLGDQYNQDDITKMKKIGDFVVAKSRFGAWYEIRILKGIRLHKERLEKTYLTIWNTVNYSPTALTDIDSSFGFNVGKGDTPLYETLPKNYKANKDELLYLYKD